MIKIYDFIVVDPNFKTKIKIGDFFRNRLLRDSKFNNTFSHYREIEPKCFKILNYLKARDRTDMEKNVMGTVPQYDKMDQLFFVFATKNVNKLQT